MGVALGIRLLGIASTNVKERLLSKSCLAAGYNRDGVVKLVGGTLQAVAVFKSNCEVLGLWLWAQLGRQAAWRPRCIRIGVVWLVASCLQMLISVCLFGLWLWAQLGRQAAWRPRCIRIGVAWLVASCLQLL